MKKLFELFGLTSSKNDSVVVVDFVEPKNDKPQGYCSEIYKGRELDGYDRMISYDNLDYLLKKMKQENLI